MIAVDTNILVYSHRAEMPLHTRSVEVIDSLRNGMNPWAIPWTCIHEFLGIVTQPKIFKIPTPMSQAVAVIEIWLAGENLQLLAESEGYLDILRGIVIQSHVRGPKIHDARIAALCLHHGVTELWTADRDFSNFPKLKTRNPLIDR